jgi:transposase-like protein
MAEIEATSYVAVGRKYGVSDNAIRKWVRQYEREAGALEGDAEPRAGPP